jgi:hypothetical protein
MDGLLGTVVDTLVPPGQERTPEPYILVEFDKPNHGWGRRAPGYDPFGYVATIPLISFKGIAIRPLTALEAIVDAAEEDK